MADLFHLFTAHLQSENVAIMLKMRTYKTIIL